MQQHVQKTVWGLGLAVLLLSPQAMLRAAETAAGGAVPPGFEPLPAVHAERLAEAFHLVESLGNDVWPGFVAHDAPVILVVDETEYLLNAAQPAGGFTDARDETFRDRPVFARARVFGHGLRATFPAIGRETVVVGTAEQTGLSPAAWTVMVGHELFHVFQDARGLTPRINALAIGAPDDSSWHLGFPFPYDDRAIQSALHLLGTCAYRALALPEDAEQAELARAVRSTEEAFSQLVRLLDLDTGDRRHADYLRYQTGKEGVARYVEYRLAERAAATDYEPLPAFAARLAAPGNPYADLWRAKYQRQPTEATGAGRLQRDRVVFYGLGQGLALVLDRAGEDWKQRLFDEDVWLDDLLAEAAERLDPWPSDG